MRMLGHDKTTLGLQGRSYYTSHDLLASVVGEPTRLEELQVLRTLVVIVDPNVLVPC